eukprot:11333167-Karenia_brevis.AAC.1
MAFSAKIRFFKNAQKLVDEKVNLIQDALSNCPIGQINFENASHSCWQWPSIACKLQSNFNKPSGINVSSQELASIADESHARAINQFRGRFCQPQFVGLQRSIYGLGLSRLPAPTLEHTLSKRLRARLIS